MRKTYNEFGKHENWCTCWYYIRYASQCRRKEAQNSVINNTLYILGLKRSSQDGNLTTHPFISLLFSILLLRLFFIRFLRIALSRGGTTQTNLFLLAVKMENTTLGLLCWTEVVWNRVCVAFKFYDIFKSFVFKVFCPTNRSHIEELCWRDPEVTMRLENSL